jgi:hypothetical protein
MKEDCMTQYSFLVDGKADLDAHLHKSAPPLDRHDALPP